MYYAQPRFGLGRISRTDHGKPRAAVLQPVGICLRLGSHSVDFAKDQQITDLSTRFGNLSDRFADTQKLLGAMQRMFAPLLGQGDPYAAVAKSETMDAQSPRSADSEPTPA